MTDDTGGHDRENKAQRVIIGGARRRHRPWAWAIAGLFVALTVGATAWWLPRTSVDGALAASAPTSNTGRERSRGAASVPPVSVAPVQRRDVQIVVNAIGTITASNTAIVRTQVSGVLQSLNFKEGQQVQAGQWLAQIDPRAFEATLAQAEGALARDRAQLAGARVDLVRYQGLLAKDGIPKQQLDTQTALVAQLEGTVKLDQATVETARLQLSYTRVVAPISGRVGLKQADLGNVVQPNDANGIVSITQTRPIALIFALPSANVPTLTARLRAGTPVPVEAWDRSGAQRLAIGQVASLDNAMDPITDTLKVKALFPNADDALFPNQAVNVILQLDTLKETLAMPRAAVLRGAKGFYVYVVNADDTVNLRIVQPGAVDGELMAIAGDLKPGEQVVIDGMDRLREGAKVAIISTDGTRRARVNAPTGGDKDEKGSAVSETPPTSAAPTEGGERPRWMDRAPPEMVEKLKQMSPEERRAWFRQRRESEGGSERPAP